MTAVCERHQRPAAYVVRYYEALPGGDLTSLDELACDEWCTDPFLSGLNRSWFAVTPAWAEEITGDERVAS